MLSCCSQVLYEDCRMVTVSAPYVAGFLAFREVPFLVEAVQRLQQEEPRLRPQVWCISLSQVEMSRGCRVLLKSVLPSPGMQSPAVFHWWGGKCSVRVVSMDLSPFP